ncbi:hypothetical protein CK203_078579 [Vitis vinifera]|uniref:Uncharacterized protein n=1 Tax=Vitis vinifera TaxID=29760 RepID=A0A438FAA4_VITVI|nr:hypothetical protein CK203_078579 [Vitis vinifera]
MFKEFHKQNAFLKSLNNTFLVLLPKKGGTKELGDFRPISLLGGLYKLLAKVLTNRIKNVIGKVVSPDQNAFVMGRQILDASLIANEGFEKKWGSRLSGGNGCGVVSQLLNFQYWAVEGGFISECNIRRGSGPVANISHLLFVDDTIVFCERKKEDMTYLSWILCWFEVVSGLRINLAKSEIIPVGEVEEILEMAVELGCKVGQLPSTYLELPLGASNKASFVWDGVEERVRWKLALWKRGKKARKAAKRLLVGRGKYGKKSPPSQLEKGVCGFARAKDEMWKQVLTAKYGKRNLGGGLRRQMGLLVLGFPQLFVVAAQRNATVGDMWDQNSGQGGWNLRFIRDFNDWELDVVGELLQVLRSQRITLEEDSVSWKGGKNGKFGVKKAYNLLISPSVSMFPKNGIWVENVPTKLVFFAWEAAWGKVLTLIGFKREGDSFLIVVIYVVAKRKM